ncbi:RAC family serine/threonine-protein kinase like protein [Tritrichomonas foetus]|uniref:RAC family serine/threonine-protein kinase like protein n=1 Tax=Tritrichomonas foetus TaxID=1144522 RepID=A0A1J4JJW0_9EUKA|nr:RAC family serine/threonine-protein kinase like protein [Tritrichomonas foetus]|eukprot:OHS97803.1 RAC family serine/threonine-protein kinase like protein [Tritrichomonas foetus]
MTIQTNPSSQLDIQKLLFIKTFSIFFIKVANYIETYRKVGFSHIQKEAKISQYFIKNSENFLKKGFEQIDFQFIHHIFKYFYVFKSIQTFNQLYHFDIIMEGWLEKKSRIGFWSKRYFKLNENKLIILKNPTDSHPELEINMTSMIKTELGDPKNNKFKILLPKHETIYLKAATKNLMMRWILDIRACAFTNPSISMEMFDKIAVIGRGFYGKVMLCKNKSTNELVAIKVVKKSRLIELKKLHTILKERTILVRQRHPFIITLKYAFQSTNKFFLCLEYAPGGDFFHFLRSHTPNLHDFKLYIAEISLAINELHKNGILYRDLKPENILLDEKGHVKLTDFGLCEYLIDNEQALTFCGTAEYMAPEVIINKGYGFEVDWWAVGILAYEMCYKSTPFKSFNRDYVYHAIVKNEPVFPKDSNPDIVELIKSLLQKNPKERGNFDTIKNSNLFKDYDFTAVYNKKILPNFVPEIDDPNDLSNFDLKYDKEKSVDSQNANSHDQELKMFSDFSFNIFDLNNDDASFDEYDTPQEGKSAPSSSILSTEFVD